MAGRYELTDQRWLMIKVIVSPPQTMVHPRRDDRLMLNGLSMTALSALFEDNRLEVSGEHRAVHHAKVVSLDQAWQLNSGEAPIDLS